MKIENDNARAVDRGERADEAGDDKRAEGDDEADDFDKLLEKKRQRKEARKEKGARARAGKEKSGQAGDALRGGRGGKGLRQGEFGERVREGSLQRGDQEERKSLVRDEHQTTRQVRDKQGDEESRDRQFRRVESAHTDASGEDVDGRRLLKESKKAGPNDAAPTSKRGGPDGSAAPEEGDGRLEATAGTTEAAAGSSGADKADRAQRSQMPPEIARLAEKIVERAQIGRDAAGRRIMMLDLHVPERGNVRVRLRRRGEGFEVRMRADNEDLARDLRREREQFRRTASDNGVDFTSIEIA